MKRIALWAAPLAAALCLGSTQLAAHAQLKRATPPVGGTVTVADLPAEMHLWFSETIEPSFVQCRITDAEGNQVDLRNPRVNPEDHTEIRVSLPRLTPGLYRVSWRVMSVDTHRTNGTFPFHVEP
ncbi:MAG TPA: copper resistance CopC family protein [Alphaproteobacteria bacterium]